MMNVNGKSHTSVLITGPGHSATRLLVKMFERHPEVSVPSGILNSVSEYIPLHQYFIQCMDRTSLSSNEYYLDEKDLFLLLDAYMSNVDKGKSHSVLKMPYHPLTCLESFVRYFQSKIVLVYMDRPADKVVRSYLRRNEDELYFKQRPIEILRQVKTLSVDERVATLATLNPREYFYKLVDRCNQLREQWDRQNPEQTFITVDVEELGSSLEYLAELLDRIGISRVALEEMARVVDEERLMERRRYKRLKASAINFVRFSVWRRLRRSIEQAGKD